MRRTRTGYVLALMAGCAVVGASTAGVATATQRHDQALSAATAATVGVVVPQPSAAPPVATSTPPVANPADTSPAVASSSGDKAADTSPVPAPAPSRVAVVTPTADPAVRAAAPTTTKAAARRTATARTAAAAPAKFHDGQYSATGSYNSPGGIEKLGVTITLSHDKVTVSALQLLGGAGLSHSFQSAFASAYSSQVVGRSIDTISLGAVSGSSLTSLGFNDALKQIQTEARA